MADAFCFNHATHPHPGSASTLSIPPRSRPSAAAIHRIGIGTPSHRTPIHFTIPCSPSRRPISGLCAGGGLSSLPICPFAIWPFPPGCRPFGHAFTPAIVRPIITGSAPPTHTPSAGLFSSLVGVARRSSLRIHALPLRAGHTRHITRRASIAPCAAAISADARWLTPAAFCPPHPHAICSPLLRALCVLPSRLVFSLVAHHPPLPTPHTGRTHRSTKS